MNKSAYLRNIFILLFVVLASVCEGQNPQWINYNANNSGLPSNIISSIAIEKFLNKNIIWIGTIEGLTRFDGTNWTTFDTSNSPLPNSLIKSISIDSKGNKWICTDGSGLVKFDGMNWTIYDTLNSDIQSNRLICIDIGDNDKKWIGTFGKGLIKYNDTVWINYNTANSKIFSDFIISVAIDLNIKWLGTTTSGVESFDDILWTIYNTTNSGLPYDWIRSIYIDSDGNKWICTNFGGLAFYNSNQNFWNVYNVNNSGLPTNNILSIIISRNNIKWIGTLGGGLARFNDTNWYVYNNKNSPLPKGAAIHSLKLDSSNNLWMSSTSGLFLFNENGIVNIQEGNVSILNNFHLHQNYPNPFNSSTIIKYSVTKKSNVILKIFNMLGEEITAQFYPSQNIGEHLYQFNSEGLPSGVYYYKLLVDQNYVDAKKMLLIK